MLLFILCVPCAHGEKLDSGFQPDETVTYRIEKMKVKAGKATLQVQERTKLDGRDVCLIVFRADGFNFLDEEVIYADPVTFHPILIKRDLNIFGRKEKITEEYLAEGKVKITKHVGDKTLVETLNPGGRPDNIYSFILRTRRQGKFELGEELNLHLPTSEVKVVFKKKMNLKIFGKDYEALYMESRPGKYKIWFDASPFKLPLKIIGAMGIADTTMVMTDYKQGHQSPVTSHQSPVTSHQ